MNSTDTHIFLCITNSVLRLSSFTLAEIIISCARNDILQTTDWHVILNDFYRQ